MKMNRLKQQCTVTVITKNFRDIYLLCSKIINFRENMTQCICSKVSALNTNNKPFCSICHILLKAGLLFKVNFIWQKRREQAGKFL